MTSTPVGGLPQQSSVTTTATKSLLTGAGSKPLDQEQLLIAQMLERQAKEKKALEIASWVNAEYTKCKNARMPFERQWYLNLAFTAGKQYVAPVDMPGQGFRLTSPKAPPWRVRIVINKVRTAVRTECSKLSSSKPIPTVLPSTNENEDLTAARISEMLLKAHFRTAEYEKTHRSWVWWGVVCGVSYLKSYWDATAEDYDSMTLPPPPTMPDGSPIPPQVLAMNPQIQEQMNTPVPAKGKIFTERVTPFHIYVPDLLAEDLEKQPYIIQVMTKSPGWVEKKFGFKPRCDVRASNTIMDAATIISKNSEEHLDSVLVKECWIKPNTHPDFPEGGLVTIINERAVQIADRWPTPFKEYPFYKYDGIPTGGFYGDSVVVDLIPLQKEYNRTRSQIIEIKNTMGKPKLMYQQGSINPKKITSEPGQAISYTAGYQPPTVLPAAEIPSTMPAEIQQLTAEFDDISGQHEITRGSTPSQVTSGTAISFLQEQDDSKLHYQVMSIENAIETLGKHYLKYVATYWEEPRIIKVTGRDNTFESMKWKGSDLKGNTDVKVQSGSALPYSKAARSAMLTEWMTMGLLDPMMGMELLEMPVLGKALDEMLVDKRQALRENAKLADAPVEELQYFQQPQPDPTTGEVPPPMQGPNGQQMQMNGDGTPFQPKSTVSVNSWDNHEAHIQYHNEYRKTQEFELLSDEHKQNFELHVQLHQFALMSTMMNAQGRVVSPGPPVQGPPGTEEGSEPPSEEPVMEEQL